MKANRPQIESALKAAGRQHRFLLLHGPDEAGARALARLLAEAVGKDAERVDLAGNELKSDPARLADEAASIPLFGGDRYICVTGGDEIVPAIEALLAATAAGNPVLVLAGALRSSSRLLKLALSEARALAFASYVPEGRDADRLVLDLGRQRGLTMRPELARRIAESAGGNRAVIESELDKFALFLDAAAERPQTLEQDALDALGAASEGGDLSRLVDGVSDGDAPLVEAELMRLSSQGVEGISLIRAQLRRILLLARLRAEVDRGSSPDAVMASQGKSLFWKEKEAVGQQLRRWRSDLLAKAATRLLEAERQVKAPGGLGPLAVGEELFAICRQAARLR
ncbi:MAG TPA: DNA polymerase III subunit delta [Allosphingosinicella sp.]|nr:DNA polymerase III subunit delta [Allosphingosinicella sp.]